MRFFIYKAYILIQQYFRGGKIILLNNSNGQAIIINGFKIQEEEVGQASEEEREDNKQRLLNELEKLLYNN